MIPSPFEYQKATSVEDALSLITDGDEEVKLLAGGHSLLPVMKLRLSTPTRLIDIGQLRELNYIEEDGNFISIGSMTTHHQLEASAVLKEKAPALAQAASQIGDMQVRNAGTVGGSLAHADPAADYPGVALALDAEFVIRSAQNKRTLKAAEFFVDLYTTALEPNELLVGVRVPVSRMNQNSCYLKFPQPASRFPIVGCAAALEKEADVCKAIRVAFSGVGNVPFRDNAVEQALAGKTIDHQSIADAAAHATEGVEVLDDLHAGQDYRRHLSKVFAKRALARLG